MGRECLRHSASLRRHAGRATTALDRAGGRVIHFEGTYTRDFSGSRLRTPRYDDNQFLYRLDLADDRLAAAR